MNDQEIVHTKTSQKTFSSFLCVSIAYTSLHEWRIDDNTYNLLNEILSIFKFDEHSGDGIKILNETHIQNTLKLRDNVILFAINEPLKKAVSVSLEGNFEANHAFVNIWDTEVLNIKMLNFVLKSDSDDSQEEFKRLFERYLFLKCDNEMTTFEEYIKNNY